MRSPPSLVVFDLDGTLVETIGDLVATLDVVLAMEGVPPVPLAEARPMVGAGARALITRGFAAAGRTVSPERLEAIFRAFLAHYEAHIADRSHLYPGVREALVGLAEDGHRLAVLTNKFQAPAAKLLDAMGIGAQFQAVCGQDTFAVCKPDPTALLLAIDRAGGTPGTTVMVGDSKTDIDTAKGAAVPVAAVDFGYSDVPVAHLAPDRVVTHFDEIRGVVHALLAGRS